MSFKKPLHREKMPFKLGPPPKASSPQVSKSMKANIAKGTKPELLLRKALWRAGLKGYRLNWTNVPGRPDICFSKKKIAIFVNGCFWHRCPHCNLSLPKTNKIFWETKFQRNVERDRLKKEKLEKLGWKVLVFWECEINKKLHSVIKNIKKTLTEKMEK